MLPSTRVPAFLLLLTAVLIPVALPAAASGQEFPRRELREEEERERPDREREIERREERERDEFRRDVERERDEMRRDAERFQNENNQPRPWIGERAEAFEQRRREQMEREHHHAMLEGQRLDFEMHKLHMERVASQARIANDPLLSAAFALERLPELLPNVKERREVLEEFLETSQNAAVQRLIRMKLLELPTENREREEALEIIESLIH